MHMMRGARPGAGTPPREDDRGRIGPALWLLPAAFLVHDGEELLTMPGWITAHREELDQLARLSPLAAHALRSLATTLPQVAVAVASVGALVLVVTAGAALTRRPGFWLYAYASVLGAMFLHVFTHLAQALLVRGYVPGLYAAVLAVLPATTYIYRRLFRARLLTRRSAWVTACVGLALLLPGALAAHGIGRLLGCDAGCGAVPGVTLSIDTRRLGPARIGASDTAATDLSLPYVR